MIDHHVTIQFNARHDTCSEYTVYHSLHQAFGASDKIIKYGISESIIKGLYYDIVGNKIIIRTCIMDSEMPYFLEWNLKVKMEISVFPENQYRAKRP